MPVSLTSLPAYDLENTQYSLDNYCVFSTHRPANSSVGLLDSAICLSDEAVLKGNDNQIYCINGPSGSNAIVSLYRTSQSRASTHTVIDGLRFGYARYGIMTPFAADRPGGSQTPAYDYYYLGDTIIRNIWGQAYERAIRVSGRNTLVENFNLWNVGGTTAEPSLLKRVSGITLNGPQPVIRNGNIRGIVQVAPGEHIQECVALYFEQDCDGGIMENVDVWTPTIPPGSSFGIWVGYSHGVHIRNCTISNLQHAIQVSSGGFSSGLIENCHSYNCTYGFGYVATNPSMKLRNVWDHQLVGGVWQSTDVSNI